MPSFQPHCAEALEAFGQPFEAVQLWLDEFAARLPFGMRHRRVRHHLAGIEEVRKLWGDQAAVDTVAGDSF